MTATLVLHLGPHKTATTFLQETLVGAETALADEGVRYAVTGRNGAAHHDLAFALWSPERRTNLMSAGRTLPTWDDLADEVDRAEDGERVVVSTENLAHVRDDEIDGARVLAERDVRVELVVGVRRLESLLPSLWQEGVKWGRQWAFDDAVGHLLGEDRVRLLPMLDRWADAARPQAVHALTMPVAGDPAALLNAVADVVDCAPATLVAAAPVAAVNTSLSWVHVEALRSVSATLDPAGAESSLLARQQVLHQLLRSAPPDVETSSRPVVPAALRPELRAVQAGIEDGLARRGVVVHGALPGVDGTDGIGTEANGTRASAPTPGDVDRVLAWMLDHDHGTHLTPDARDAVAATRRRLRERASATDGRWWRRLTFGRRRSGDRR